MSAANAQDGCKIIGCQMDRWMNSDKGRTLRVWGAPHAAVCILHGVHRQRLEAPPANGEGQGVARFQDFGGPAVALDAELQEGACLFRVRQAPHQQWLCRIPVLHQLTRHPCSHVTTHCTPVRSTAAAACPEPKVTSSRPVHSTASIAVPIVVCFRP